jgi:DNA-binding response OmpR family regulator
MAQILVVDDDPTVREVVVSYLRANQHDVREAPDGETALRLADELAADLVVLDLMLPGIDGLEVCRRLRAGHGPAASVPVIFLTARDGEIDRVLGLEMGADDYLTKPFSPRELVARVKAVLRRTEAAPEAAPLLEVGDAVIDLGRREVRVAGTPVELTTKEFDLLRHLVERKGLALSRQQILDGVWGHGWYGDARTVDVHVAQVRKKLGGSVAITTVRGVGYRLDAPTQR